MSVRERTDITIEILRGIQSTLVKIDGRLTGHDQRLARLEGHAVATTETLGIIAERLSFFDPG